MAKHLLVLQHGINGAPDDLRNIADAVASAYPGRFHVVNSDVNTGNTKDGVVIGGRRLADLIKREAAGLDSNGRTLSIVAHSLGGIYCRSALQQLEKEGWFEQHPMSFDNFVTIATPHLGILEVEALFRWGFCLLGGCLGETIVDLSLGSSTIQDLTDEAALRTLQRFRQRTLYANLDDDKWVRTCTALVLPSLPAVSTLPPGEPWHLSDTTCRDVLTRSASAFPAGRSEEVSAMANKLNSMSWERYIVHFPADSFTGFAHCKICHHWKDTEHEGLKVQTHIVGLFAKSSDATSG